MRENHLDVEFLWSHLENITLKCVHINLILKVQLQLKMWTGVLTQQITENRWQGKVVGVRWCTKCNDNDLHSSSQSRHRGQTESRWHTNAVKDEVEVEESDPSEGVIVGRLSVVFGDKNKCEETSGQLRAEPPFHDSIRSLTLSATQKQNR